MSETNWGLRLGLAAALALLGGGFLWLGERPPPATSVSPTPTPVPDARRTPQRMQQPSRPDAPVVRSSVSIEELRARAEVRRQTALERAEARPDETPEERAERVERQLDEDFRSRELAMAGGLEQLVAEGVIEDDEADAAYDILLHHLEVVWDLKQLTRTGAERSEVEAAVQSLRQQRVDTKDALVELAGHERGAQVWEGTLLGE